MLEIRTLLKGVRERERAKENTRLRPANVLTIADIVRMKRKEGKIADDVDAVWLRIQLQAIMDGKEALLGPFDGVDGAWKGKPCFVVGGSRGIKNAMDQGFRFKMLDGFHSIGVNHVIEDYHNFEWFFFMDPRFLKIAKYDVLRDYRGRVFTGRRSGLTPSGHVTIVYTQSDGPSEHLIQGLLGCSVSGIVALNLALVSGANPIYMLGLDHGGVTNSNQHSHYKDNYTGEVLGQGNYRTRFFERIPEKLLKYAPYADRIVNVDPLGSITVFKKMGIRDVPELKGKFT